MAFEPLMTLYLTDNTTADEIRRAKASGIVHGIKLYPAGATTNSDAGVTDIKHCTKALEAILARELIYQGSRFPLASIFRTRKFIQRGWTLHIANYVKMAYQLNDLDLTNIHVLREQLTDVDAAYLNAIIRECAKTPHPITCEYVCNLVDRIIKGGEEEREDEDADS